MQNLVFAALAAGACLLATASVFANDAPDKKVAAADSFAALDRNGDNRISRSEAGFDRRLSEIFAELDTDGDGFVSAEEFNAGQKDRATVSTLTPQ